MFTAKTTAHTKTQNAKPFSGSGKSQMCKTKYVDFCKQKNVFCDCTAILLIMLYSFVTCMWMVKAMRAVGNHSTLQHVCDYIGRSTVCVLMTPQFKNTNEKRSKKKKRSTTERRKKNYDILKAMRATAE